MKRVFPIVLSLSTLTIAAFCADANAQLTGDVLFNSTVVNVCTVAISTPGTMVYDTEEQDMNEGIAGEFTVLNTAPGGQVTIDPPTDFGIAPGDYAGTPSFAYRYNFTGANTIGDVTVSNGTEAIISLPLLGLNTGELYSSATTSGGPFTTGAYTATYTVTCS